MILVINKQLLFDKKPRAVHSIASLGLGFYNAATVSVSNYETSQGGYRRLGESPILPFATPDKRGNIVSET